MTLQFFVPLLAMVTLGAGIAVAWRGSRRVRDMRQDDEVPPSSLSADGDDRKAQTDETLGRTA